MRLRQRAQTAENGSETKQQEEQRRVSWREIVRAAGECEAKTGAATLPNVKKTVENLHFFSCASFSRSIY
jgi:hypothetical protein